jgi:hypothetical protein
MSSSGTEQAALKHLRALQSELERVDEEASAKVCVASRLACRQAGAPHLVRSGCTDRERSGEEAAACLRAARGTAQHGLASAFDDLCCLFSRCPWPLSATCSAWAGANLAIASILADGTTKIDLCKRLDHR